MTLTTNRVTKYLDLVARVNELNRAIDCIVIIGGGVLQYATFFETANMGLATILVDGDGDCYCRSLANHFVRVSTREPFKVVSRVKEFLQQRPDLRVVAVYTQGCDVEVTVSHLAHSLGLPGVSQKAAQNCNNKIDCRILFANSYVPQPEWGYCEDVEGVKGICSKLKYPCVVKSVDNSASRGLTIINSDEQIPEAVNNALKHSIDQRILVEKFVDGNEYSVDTIVYRGVLYPCGISDREFDKSSGYAIQTGSLTPSLLPSDKQIEIYKVMGEAARALGVDNSAFKGDIIIDKDGRVLVIEVTARLSGGFDSQYRKPLSFGLNLIKATIDLAMGKQLDFNDIIPKYVKWSKTFHVFPKPGVIKDIKGLDARGHIEGVSGVKKVFLIKKVGDIVGYKNCADRVVHIIGCADTLEQLREVEKNAQEKLQVITE